MPQNYVRGFRKIMAEVEKFVKLWEPSEQFKREANLSRYIDWLREIGNADVDDYGTLWQWSVDELAAFWESLWEFFEIQSVTPYQRVLTTESMPGATWFTGATLNYVEHIFRHATLDRPALIFESELRRRTEVSWAELRQQTAVFQTYLRQNGVEAGDRVVAYLPAIQETAVAFFATAALGATWSSCSPDFGTNSVIDRFQQISPKVLLVVDGYQYGGQPFDRHEAISRLRAELPTVEKVIFVPYLNPETAVPTTLGDATSWVEVMATPPQPLTFTAVPFDHPIWVLYSSGTTGIPKAITHGHGGVLLEHLKIHVLHNNLKLGDRYFWMSTTGWVMWNIVIGSLLAGTTAVFYDGNPGYPTLNRMWQLVADNKINLFGTSAAFLIASMKAQLTPKQFDLDALVSIGSTGSPLPAEGFDWVYEQVKADLWLASVSGGTDVASGFVGNSPLLPVYRGEIQCRNLGVAVYAFDEMGQPQIGQVGEMVITKPMPSMPIYFWNDANDERYKASYFEMYPGYWQHGDWMRISQLGTINISGRSDSTLNRLGVRIGSSEIYRAVDSLPEIVDSLVVGLELTNGRYYMPLFVALPAGQTLSDELKQTIKTTIRHTFTPRHVPDDIIQIPEVPYTLSGKKLETPIKRLLLGADPAKVINIDATKSPTAIDFFIDFATKVAAM